MRDHFKVAVMQPYLFPYIGYFQLVKSVDFFVFLDDVKFAKKTWINRNQLCVHNQPFVFTIPLHKASQNRNINEHYIISDWIDSLEKTMVLAYKKAPFFNENFDDISKLLAYCDGCNLAQAASRCVKDIAKWLDISTLFLSSTQFSVGNRQKQDRILKICHDLGAFTYINAIGGKKIGMYHSKDFEPINLRYIQREDGLENYSIIHYLFTLGREKTKQIITKYKIIR